MLTSTDLIIYNAIKNFSIDAADKPRRRIVPTPSVPSFVQALESLNKMEYYDIFTKLRDIAHNYYLQLDDGYKHLVNKGQPLLNDIEKHLSDIESKYNITLLKKVKDKIPQAVKSLIQNQLKDEYAKAKWMEEHGEEEYIEQPIEQELSLEEELKEFKVKKKEEQEELRKFVVQPSAKKSFELNSIFQDMYFETRKPSEGWNLEPKTQPDRTLSPVMRREQLDDIAADSDKKTKKPKNPYGFLPMKKRIKFIVENPASSGLGGSGQGSGIRETSTMPRVRPVPVRAPQNLNKDHNVEWLDRLSFKLNSSESPMLIPYRDLDDGFHRTKLKIPGEGHFPFMRHKLPGEGISKIPISDSPDKPNFETSPKVLKRYKLRPHPKKSFEVVSDGIIDRAYSGLYKKYMTELYSEYKDEILDDAVEVWTLEDIDKADMMKKFDELTALLNSVDKEQFIAILKSYKKKLGELRHSVDGATGLTTSPYYGKTNVYPYSGTGPGIGPSSYLDMIVDTQQIRDTEVNNRQLTRIIGDKKSFKLKAVTYGEYIEDKDAEWGVTEEDAKKIGDELNIDWDTISLDQFRIGMSIELEHGSIYPETNVIDEDTEVSNDLLTAGKIALVHLLEVSAYYDKLLTHVEAKKSFKLEATKHSISDDAYDAFTEKGYAFKNYQLSPEQINDAIDHGKDLSILLKHQEMSDKQKTKAINKAIEKRISLVYIYESEKENLDEAQFNAVVTALYEKAAQDGTNLQFVLSNFNLEEEKKNSLIMKGLQEGIGLHYLFKSGLLNDEQREFAVNKAIETGYGLLDLLKHERLNDEQKKKIINKAIEKGVALIYILRKEEVTEDQKKEIFNKALQDGKGYYYLLKQFKLSPEQLNMAIQRSKTSIDNLRYILQYQEVSDDQQKFIEGHVEKLKVKQQEKREKDIEKKRSSKGLFLIPGESGYSELNMFFNAAEDDSAVLMHELIADERFEDAKEFLYEWLDDTEDTPDSKKSFKLEAAPPEDEEDIEEDEVAEEVEDTEDEEETEEDEEESFDNERDILGLIEDAASSKNMLWIKYRDRFGTTTEREVEPWEIRDDYYMFAHDPNFAPHHGSDIGTRQFILAAILDANATNSPYDNPDRWEMKI